MATLIALTQINFAKGVPMKRDMDTVRKIILATADLPYDELLRGVEGISENEFVMHVIWLSEAGLVQANAQRGTGSMANFAMVQRLTWDGCEFADAIRSDTLWSKAQDKILKPGISFTFDVLKDWLKAEIAQGLPTLKGIT